MLQFLRKLQRTVTAQENDRSRGNEEDNPFYEPALSDSQKIRKN